jgi:hypothetical protein
MKSIHFVEFTVSGFGQFPIDMLRYDRCFPADERESGQIMNTFTRRIRTWEIRLSAYASNKAWMPCKGRWESFGCQVSGITHL